ncbi:DUF1592 domain-containing protein [Agaribacter marinus]|uniref:Planctomycete cytochrome C n=1 Tax=Agaribacter marinus TaxID=1431249 RepID=A0AA37WIP4_9ALTE|nr:DUF1592 domain-containing protein [Agaribacter marinus]GLR69604.1 hypothetical protein GCM10007852_05120 [Agaribacter marinus]
MRTTSATKIFAVLLTLAAVLIAVAIIVPINGQAGDGLYRFLGRFHVLILHFPITLLLLAPFIWLLSRTKRFSHYQSIVLPLWWLGSLSAAATVTMGLLLAANEGFTFEEVQQHMIAGLSVALIAFICTGIANYLDSNNTTINKKLKLLPAAASAVLVTSIFVAAHAGGNLVHGETYLTRFSPEPLRTWLSTPSQQLELSSVTDQHYVSDVRPLLKKYCFDCHGADTQKGNVQLDNLDPDFVGGVDASHWHSALDMINSGEMPPKKKLQPTDDERREIVAWMTKGIRLAKEAKKGDSQYVMRRLTKDQYTNTLQDLLGVAVDFGAELPDDPMSTMGFSNSGELLQSSTLHLESFETIARVALEKAINSTEKPKVHHYRMYFGDKIGLGEKNTLSAGYLDTPLHQHNFKIETMNDAQHLSSTKKFFSASLRGSDQRRFSVLEDSISLYSAKPHKETTIAGQYGAWHGPSPNLAMQIKDQYPREGDFVVRVKASKGNGFTKLKDALTAIPPNKPIATLEKGQLNQTLQFGELARVPAPASKFTGLDGLVYDKASGTITNSNEGKDVSLSGPIVLEDLKSHLYQIDLLHPELPPNTESTFTLTIRPYKPMTITLKPTGQAPTGELVVSSIAIGYISKPWHHTLIKGDKYFPGFNQFVFTKLDDAHPIATSFPKQYFDNPIDNDATPVLIPYLGTRTDDGMDYKTFSQAVDVSNTETGQVYEFKGRLENLPVPYHGTQGDHITSSSLKIGVWNDDKIKSETQNGSVINVEYIEFEAPYFDQWPTTQHQRIFIPSSHPKGSEAYAKEVISTFAQRAFRRAVSDDDISHFMALWHDIKDDFDSFEEGIKETLVAVLSSPNFLFLVEPQRNETEIASRQEQTSLISNVKSLFMVNSAHASQSTQSIDEYALANRLSYFLWNSPPDEELLHLAANNQLSSQLEAQLQRMLKDEEKLMRFIKVFSKEWLRLDRQQMQSVDVDTYPDYTRFVKHDMQQETLQFMRLLMQDNLSALNIIDSDFAMLNQNLAEFYGIPNVKGRHFRPVSLTSNKPSPERMRGGLLSQGAFLTGHGDGVHSHPVKRAVWVKQKILGDEPPPPPPNVPDLDPETPGFEKLTLKQQLEMHRDKESCRDCHAKIDPFGVVFENYDAVGRYRAAYKKLPIDASSILPDGTNVNGISDIKTYLMKQQGDEVVRSLLKHLFSYALGKDVSFHDDEEIDSILQAVKNNEYRMQSILFHIISSPSFLNTQGANS